MNTSGSSALRRVASEPIPDGVVRVRFHKTIPTFVALRRYSGESEGKAGISPARAARRRWGWPLALRRRAGDTA